MHTITNRYQFQVIIQVLQLRGRFLNGQWVHPQDRLCLDKPSELLPPICCFRQVVFQTRCSLERYPRRYHVHQNERKPSTRAVFTLMYSEATGALAFWWGWVPIAEDHKMESWPTAVLTPWSHGSGLYPLCILFAHYQIHQGDQRRNNCSGCSQSRAITSRGYSQHGESLLVLPTSLFNLKWVSNSHCKHQSIKRRGGGGTEKKKGMEILTVTEEVEEQKDGRF